MFIVCIYHHVILDFTYKYIVTIDNIFCAIHRGELFYKLQSWSFANTLRVKLTLTESCEDTLVIWLTSEVYPSPKPSNVCRKLSFLNVTGLRSKRISSKCSLTVSIVGFILRKGKNDIEFCYSSKLDSRWMFHFLLPKKKKRSKIFKNTPVLLVLSY